MAAERVIGAVHAVGIHLARVDATKIGMPDVVGSARQTNARFSSSGRIEQAKIDGGRVSGKEGKVDTAPVPMRSEFLRIALLHTDHQRRPLGRKRTASSVFRGSMFLEQIMVFPDSAGRR